MFTYERRELQTTSVERSIQQIRGVLFLASCTLPFLTHGEVLDYPLWSYVFFVDKKSNKWSHNSLYFNQHNIWKTKRYLTTVRKIKPTQSHGYDKNFINLILSQNNKSCYKGIRTQIKLVKCELGSKGSLKNT